MLDESDARIQRRFFYCLKSVRTLASAPETRNPTWPTCRVFIDEPSISANAHVRANRLVRANRGAVRLDNTIRANLPARPTIGPAPTGRNYIRTNLAPAIRRETNNNCIHRRRTERVGSGSAHPIPSGLYFEPTSLHAQVHRRATYWTLGTRSQQARRRNEEQAFPLCSLNAPLPNILSGPQHPCASARSRLSDERPE